MRSVRRLGVVGMLLLITGLLTVGPASSTTEPKVCNGQIATIVGTTGDDNLTDDTDPAPDIVWLGPGNDTWDSAGSGADIICGGRGADRIFGANVAARILGGPGPDQIAGFGAATVATGGAGNDFFEQGSGVANGGKGDDDFIVGGDGTSKGGPGNDHFNVQQYASGSVHGGQGKDEAYFYNTNLHVNLTTGFAYWDGGQIQLDGIRNISGTPYADVLIGSPRADTIDGVLGKDTIKGRGGNDKLGSSSGEGASLYGGKGYDACSGDHRFGCETWW